MLLPVAFAVWWCSAIRLFSYSVFHRRSAFPVSPPLVVGGASSSPLLLLRRAFSFLSPLQIQLHNSITTITASVLISLKYDMIQSTNSPNRVH
ncbi:hypothetical protein S83_034940 [Arachis hypogaea]